MATSVLVLPKTVKVGDKVQLRHDLTLGPPKLNLIGMTGEVTWVSRTHSIATVMWNVLPLRMTEADWYSGLKSYKGSVALSPEGLIRYATFEHAVDHLVKAEASLTPNCLHCGFRLTAYPFVVGTPQMWGCEHCGAHWSEEALFGATMANMIKPITPDEALKAKYKAIPPEVFDIINGFIVQHLSQGEAVISQKEIVDALVERKFNRQGIYDKGFLDIEPLYEAAGWQVDYKKPAYNEEGEATFTFKAVR